MPRAKTHSREDALHGAMALFWEKGFHSTSMEELVQSTGVSRYSFYEHFQSKRDLFLEALDHYFRRVTRPQLSILEQDDSGIDELKTFFAKAVMYATSEEGRRGCFLCNTATELAPHDLEVAHKLRGYRDHMLGLFVKTIRNGQGQGRVRKDISLEGVAAELFILMQGMMVLCKIPGSGRLVEKAVHATLLGLRPEDQPAAPHLAESGRLQHAF